MTLNEYIREFICQIEHFTDYIEDAVEYPDLVDFDVIRGKVELVRQHMTGVERQLGIVRKEDKKNGSREDSPTSKAQQGKEGPRKVSTRPDSRSTQAPRHQSGTRQQSGGARRKR